VCGEREIAIGDAIGYIIFLVLRIKPDKNGHILRKKNPEEKHSSPISFGHLFDRRKLREKNKQE
jgi:hypothetical protein